MNKKIKWILLIVFTAYIGVLIMDKFDKRPIRFEDFKTSEELESFLYKKYPIGSDVDKIKKMMLEGGAKCEMIRSMDRKSNITQMHDFSIYCKYSTGLISFHPLESYEISIFSTKENKLTDIYAIRSKGIII
jgi:hypothetical protein